MNDQDLRATIEKLNAQLADVRAGFIKIQNELVNRINEKNKPPKDTEKS